MTKRLKIIPNPDKAKYDEMTQAVKNCDGFCPCELERTPDTRCMCKAFREQMEPGLCHCQRFIKVEIEEENKS